jgi:beta-xylosidase
LSRSCHSLWICIEKWAHGSPVGFCTKSQLPADFISIHHYPTDAFGQPRDDTEAQLSKSRRSVLRDETREVRRKAGDRPVYYTEWCTSSNPRDPMHDEPYADGEAEQGAADAARAYDDFLPGRIDAQE